MRNEVKKSLAVCFICLFLFCGVFFAAISFPSPMHIDKNTDTEILVPYGDDLPKNTEFILLFANCRYLIQFDFENSLTHLIPSNSTSFYETEKFINLKDEYTADVIDRFGGVELTINLIGEKYDNVPRNYTGNQITEVFYEEELCEFDKNNIKTETLYKIFGNISKLGFSKSDFEYIMSVAESNISYIDYYTVSPHLKTVLSQTDYFE